MPKSTEKKPAKANQLIETLESRFQKNMSRHRAVDWAKVRARLDAKPDKVRALEAMERTDGEPDVIGQDLATGEFIFADCSAQSPADRRSLCYDREALASRKQHKPKNSAMDLAIEIGVELMTEEEYRSLQKLGEFDSKTSTWLKTPANIRKLGGAIFGDRRYDTVWVYHNGADSYYAARGFRGILRV
jgi:hypothetical protein